MKEGDAGEWVGWGEGGSRESRPGKENGGSNEGGGGHKKEVNGFDNYLGYTISKFNSRWVIYLNVNPKTIKLLEESIGKIITTLGSAKIS